MARHGVPLGAQAGCVADTVADALPEAKRLLPIAA